MYHKTFLRWLQSNHLQASFFIQCKSQLANTVHYPISIYNIFQPSLEITSSHEVNNQIGRQCWQTAFFFRIWENKLFLLTNLSKFFANTTSFYHQHHCFCDGYTDKFISNSFPTMRYGSFPRLSFIRTIRNTCTIQNSVAFLLGYDEKKRGQNWWQVINHMKSIPLLIWL